jgi:hypothetical protein
MIHGNANMGIVRCYQTEMVKDAIFITTIFVKFEVRTL